VNELRARFGSQVTIEAVAVGKTEGSAKLFLRKHSWAAGLVQIWNEENTGSIEVPVSTLDTLISKHGVPDYIKMDIEGYELAAIEGLSAPVNLMSFEYQLARKDLADRIVILGLLKSRGAKQAAILADGAQSWTVPWISFDVFMKMFPVDLPAETYFGDIFVRF
jgi:hypothetical protein